MFVYTCKFMQVEANEEGESSESLLTESEEGDEEDKEDVDEESKDNGDEEAAADGDGDASNEEDNPNMDDSNQDEMRKLFKRHRNMANLLHLITVSCTKIY